MYTYCLLIRQVGHISFKPIISRLTENEIHDQWYKQERVLIMCFYLV